MTVQYNFPNNHTAHGRAAAITYYFETYRPAYGVTGQQVADELNKITTTTCGKRAPNADNHKFTSTHIHQTGIWGLYYSPGSKPPSNWFKKAKKATAKRVVKSNTKRKNPSTHHSFVNRDQDLFALQGLGIEPGSAEHDLWIAANKLGW